MLRTLFALLLMSGVSLFAQEAVTWSGQESLETWKALRNVRCEWKNDALLITEIKADGQLISPVLNLDPSKYNRFSFRYRAKDLPVSTGELFYAHEKGGFTERASWRIPPLNADGEWHTMELSEKDLVEPSTWFQGGPVTRLRFDPTNDAGGQIEISEMKLYYSTEPPKKRRIVVARDDFPPDEPEWTAIKPEIKPVVSSAEEYFSAKMVSSPEDTGKPGKTDVFFVRREIELKEKPDQAWLQFTADDLADVFINGVKVIRADNWREAVVSEVSLHLVKGKNVWAFRYKNTSDVGGVFGEIRVHYPDGTEEKFSTDKDFRSHTGEAAGWDKTGFSDASWAPVVIREGPPHSPWTSKLKYRRFASVQQFVKGNAHPQKADAGSRIDLSYVFQGEMPALPFAGRLVFYKEGKIVWDEPFELTESFVRKESEGCWSARFELTAPRYISGENIKVCLSSDSVFFSGKNAPEIEIGVQGVGRDPKFPTPPDIRIGNGEYGPTVSINGKDIYGLCGGSRPFANAPLNVRFLRVWPNVFWPSCEKLDFSCFDRQAEEVARLSPDAWFIVSLVLYPPRDWAKKYPDEVCRDEKGEIVRDGWTNYSFSSQQALKDLRDVMEKAIRYLENSPYANRIIGYQISGGRTIEWLGWAPKWGRATDFSPAACKAFRDFAQKNYPQLQDFSVPVWQERKSDKNDEPLWDPQKHLKVIAYHDFYSQSVADMLIALCSRAKEMVQGKKLIGAYYGYTATLHRSGDSQMQAHYALKKVLDSGSVDFLLSPQAYVVRNLGDTCGDMKPYETLRRHGILPIIEDDSRTHNGPWIDNNFQALTEQASLDIFRRNLGIALCRNEWSYLVAYNNPESMNFPSLAKDLALIRKIGEFCLDRKTLRNAEIAVVVSEKSILSMPMLKRTERSGWQQRYLQSGEVRQEPIVRRVLTHETFIGNMQRLSRSGALSDYLLAEDLKDHPGEYKLYIFLNCYTYDRDFLEAVNKLRQRNCTLLWLYAPGYTFEYQNSVENMRALTGVILKKETEPLFPYVKLPDGSRMGGRSVRISPSFYADDPDVQILGTNEKDHPALVSKRTGNARSIFSSAYRLDISFLRKLAEESGIHLYSDTSDPVDANSRLVTLHARTPGKKTIRLPGKTNVVDVFNRKMLARDTDIFTFEAPLHSSWLFYCGDDADELLKDLLSADK